MTIITEDYNPFWVFEEGSNIALPQSIQASDLTQVSDNNSQSLGNGIDLIAKLENIGINWASHKVAIKFINWLDTVYSKNIVRNLLEYLENSSNSIRVILVSELTYDLIIISYAQYMSKARAIAKNPSLSQFLKGTYNWIKSESSRDNDAPFSTRFITWVLSLGEAFDDNYEIVAPLVNRRVLSFLTNCYEPLKYLNEKNYTKLLCHYVHETHTQYWHLLPLKNHQLGRYKIGELLTEERLTLTTTYFSNRYHNYETLKDCPGVKNFVKHIDDMPLS